MLSYVGLEQKIARILESISAHDLQVLAEEIALIRDPLRYRGLYGLGRNLKAQTTTGWPDAGIVAADGTIDAVEATRRRDNWQSHIEEDFEKAKEGKNPTLNGFLFVGYPKKNALVTKR